MTNARFKEQLTICVQKTRRNIAALEGGFPRFPHIATHRGWETSGDEEWKSLTDGYWTGGFWVGIMLLCHHLTGDGYFKDNARRWLLALSPRAGGKLMHDVGFLFFPSAALGFELLREDDLKITAKRAAYTMLRLYDKGRGCIPISDREQWRNVLAIDTMMNLPLLWWADAAADMPEAGEAARAHSRATARHLVRDDGSTAHIARLDPRGGLQRIESWQGAGENSCWSRGHAWALSGAAHALFFSGEDFFNSLLDRLLGYYLKNRPDDGIPFWDYDAIDFETRDASAAAIIAHALLLLTTAMPNTEMAAEGIRILENLTENYTTGVEHPGFLKKVCFHNPAGQHVECSSVFADFYYLFALCLTAPDTRKKFSEMAR
jgi:unsaturated chondroitin disaccharide hydrolase